LKDNISQNSIGKSEDDKVKDVVRDNKFLQMELKNSLNLLIEIIK